MIVNVVLPLDEPHADPKAATPAAPATPERNLRLFS